MWSACPWEAMAAVMELAQAAMSFPFPAADNPLKLPSCGPLAFAGGSLEDLLAFDVSECMTFPGGLVEGSPSAGSQGRNLVLPAEGSSDHSVVAPTSDGMNCRVGVKGIRIEPGSRVAFKTKSVADNLDDGYKWRKYGKKSVKGNPNPRNYYRCSAVGCSVKKIVQRDWEDPSFVTTTYDGVHSHVPPGVVYSPVPRDHTATDWVSSSWTGAMVAASQPSETTHAAYSSS